MRKKVGLGGIIRLSVVMSLSIVNHHSYSQELTSIFFEHSGKYGLKDTEGEILIRPRFEKLGWSQGLDISTGDVIGYYDDGWGLVSLKDRMITAPKYYTLEAVHQDLILASVIGRFSNELIYGAINSKGETIIGFKYHSIKRVRDLLIVSERKHGQSYYGLITDRSAQLLPLKYHSIRLFSNELFVFEDNQNRKGVVDQNGNILISASLDSIGPAQQSNYWVYDHGKVGLIDSLASFIRKPAYKSIQSNLSTTHFPKIALLSKGNNELNVFEADSVKALGGYGYMVFANGFATVHNWEDKPLAAIDQLIEARNFRENIVVSSPKGYSVLDQNGHSLASKSFQDVKFDQHNLYVLENKKWWIYNSYGRKITSQNFQDVISHSTNLIPVKRKGYWGFIDHTGERAISFQYDEVSRFTGQFAQVKYLGFQMLINQFGDHLGEPSYDSVRIISKDLALAKKKSRFDLFTGDGSIAFQTFNQLEDHPIGFLEKTAEGKMGLISSQGKIIFDPLYRDISNPVEGKYLRVNTDNEVGIASIDGSWLFPLTPEYEDMKVLREGMIGVKKGGRWGFVNLKNQLLIANRYDSVHSFHEGLAGIYIGGKWGFINKKEKLIIQPFYDEASCFEQGLAIVKKDGLVGLINEKGNIVLALEYEQIQPLNNGKLLVQKEGKYGVLDKKGDQLIPLSFTSINLTGDHHYIVCRRNLAGVMNDQGRYSIPLKYQRIKWLKHGQYLCFSDTALIEKSN